VDLNSLGDDVLKLLSNGDGSSSSTVASSEYKLRATVCVFPYYIGSFLCIYYWLTRIHVLEYITGVEGASRGSSDMHGNGQGMSLFVSSASRVCHRC